MSDAELLRLYCADHDGGAFSELVRRHIHMVHAAALRQTRDPHLADDVTQAVFMVLARRASHIHDSAALAGWLIKTARYASMNAIKLQSRRRIHEREAALMSRSNDNAAEASSGQLDGVLDEALSRLGGKERSAVALRYLQGKKVDEVGAALGISTEAAQKRILRGVEKLRGIFARRGIYAPADAMTLAISAHVAHAAPAGLIATVVGQSASPAAAVTVIANGTVKAMACMKMAVACCAVVLAAVGGTVLFVNNQNSANAAAPASSQPVSQATVATPPVVVASAPATTPVPDPPQFPNFTFIINNDPVHFTTGVDSETRHSAEPSLLLTSKTPQWGILGEAMRGVDPGPFRGKRVRLSAYLKCEGLANWGSLGIAVMGPDNSVLANDDMGDRPMTGTTDWKKLEIVVNVPHDAQTIFIGLYLRGAGKLWMDGARIEPVTTDVPTTDDQRWHSWSYSSPHYTVANDPATLRNGHPTLLISSTKSISGEWCAWDHNDRHPEKYLGKRMKMTCWIKTENVTGASGLSIRAMTGPYRDLQIDPGKAVRTIKGTTPWTKYELIANVPEETQDLCSGIRMGGKGRLWVDDFQFEVLEAAK